MNTKNNFIVLVLLSAVTTMYQSELIKCGKLYTMENRNLCRQEVTRKYHYIDDNTVEVHIFTLPKIQKDVVDFKEVFKDVE